MARYTDDQLRQAYKENITTKGVLESLGLCVSSYWYNKVRERAKELGIDDSHLSPESVLGNIGRMRGLANKLHWKDVLVLRSSNIRQHAHRLRRAMIESGIPYTCSRCPIVDMWNGNPIRLEINHKNGNKLDDRRKNLEFLCPNCHSQDESSSHIGESGGDRS